MTTNILNIKTKFEWNEAIWSWGGIILILTVMILIFGIVSIYSASYNPKTHTNNAYANKQIAFAVAALAPFLLVIRLDYTWLIRHAYWIYGLGLFLLILTSFIGTTRNDSRRWINLGVVMLQTSEVMKLAILPILARIFSQEKSGKITDLFLPGILTLIPMLFIMRQPDLGTSLVFVPILFGMAWASGVKKLYLFSIVVGLFLIGIVGFFFLMHDYQRQRVLMFVRQDEMTKAERQGDGYHLWQSKIAHGNGGFWGRGWQTGTQNRFGYLPEKHTDFIFAVMGEEFGFVGTSFVLLLYLFVFISMLQLASQCLIPTGQLIIIGIFAILITHTVVNTCMTIGLLPITGLPLPFLSYGGSSLMFNFIEIGLVISIAGRRMVG